MRLSVKKLLSMPAEEELYFPEYLFFVIVSHEDKSELILRALKAEKPDHVFADGITSGNKSSLQELARLQNTEYTLDIRLTAAGKYELIFTRRLRYLIPD